jgi:hypothetical protein
MLSPSVPYFLSSFPPFFLFSFFLLLSVQAKAAGVSDADEDEDDPMQGVVDQMNEELAGAQVRARCMLVMHACESQCP